jgi:hypothetical protein
MSHTETITLEETSMTGMMMMISVKLITIMVSITFDRTTTITTIIIMLMMLVGIVEKDEVIIFMVIVSS